MDEFDGLDQYNGDAEHDMWVDFTTNQYTGELADIFDDSEEDDFIGLDDENDDW